MSVNEKAVDRFVEYFNEILACDREAVSALFQARVSCGKALFTHPSVQVMTDVDDTGAFRDYLVGIIGILNGYCGTYDDGPRKGCGALAMEIDEDTGEIKRFRRVKNTEFGN